MAGSLFETRLRVSVCQWGAAATRAEYVPGAVLFPSQWLGGKPFGLLAGEVQMPWGNVDPLQNF